MLITFPDTFTCILQEGIKCDDLFAEAKKLLKDIERSKVAPNKPVTELDIVQQVLKQVSDAAITMEPYEVYLHTCYDAF